MMILGLHSCSSQSFPQLSKQLEKSCARVSNSKIMTFHDIRMKLYESGKLDFINYKQDTLFILESYDIQDGSCRGRLWNRKGHIQYNYYPKSGFNFNEDKMFTKYTIELVQRWDTVSIREEERLYSNITPIYFIYSSRVIFSDLPRIDCLKFKEFFNSKRD